MNTQFQKKAGRRWTWRSPDGNTKNEIDYIMTDKPSNQPREQAGFRSKYSTTDHIHAINQLKEKCRQYNIPLCVAFVDYEKAFDSVQTQAILTSLQEQGIEDVYIEILKDIYTDSSVTVHLHKEITYRVRMA